MNPILLRKQLCDNNKDVQDFCADLKQWSKEISKNESKSQESEKHDVNLTKSSSAENKTSKQNFAANETISVKKVSFAENVNTSSRDSAIEEAIFEKEKGNKFVKQQKWEEAIQCYTRAIKCHSRDPIFYANRALCFLKTKRWKEADNDASAAIHLDTTYVKAYQRRAVAKENLNQLLEAQSDLETVLKFEPKNRESLAELNLIRKKIEDAKESSSYPSVFRQMQQQKRKFETDVSGTSKSQESPEKLQSFSSAPNDFTKLSNDSNIQIVHPILKPPHLRSKRGLIRIDISSEQTGPQEHKVIPKATLNTEELKVVENQPYTKINQSNKAKPTTNLQRTTATLQTSDKIPVTPTNSVQFISRWNTLSKSDLKYAFLKQIDPNAIPNIFLETLESKLFSEIITVLLENIKKEDNILQYLVSFTHVKRFSTIAMFMSSKDKSCVQQLLQHAKTYEKVDEETVNYLIAQYKL